jgi:hypothetical protein
LDLEKQLVSNVNKFLTIISHLYEQYMMSAESHEKKKVEEKFNDLLQYLRTNSIEVSNF